MNPFVDRAGLGTAFRESIKRGVRDCGVSTLKRPFRNLHPKDLLVQGLSFF